MAVGQLISAGQFRHVRRSVIGLASVLVLVSAGCGSPQEAPPSTSSAPVTDSSAAAPETSTTSGQEEATTSAPDASDNFELRLATTGGAQSGNGQGVIRWAELIEENSGGRISVEYFVDGELGAEREIMEQAQVGAVDGGLVASSVLSSVSPEIEVLDLPFLFENREAARSFIEGDIEAENLLSSLSQNGLEGFAWTIAGARTVINNTRAVEAPEDMEGLKIRTIESPLFTQLWSLLGASPTPIPVSDIYVALQTGTVDAADIAPNYAVAQGYHEVAEYFTNLEHIFGISALFLSAESYAELPPDLQEVVRVAAQEAASFESELNAGLDAEALDVMRQAGLTVTTEFDRAAFQEKMEPVYDSYAERLGADLISRIREAASGY